MSYKSSSVGGTRGLIRSLVPCDLKLSLLWVSEIEVVRISPFICEGNLRKNRHLHRTCRGEDVRKYSHGSLSARIRVAPPRHTPSSVTTDRLLGRKRYHRNDLSSL